MIKRQLLFFVFFVCLHDYLLAQKRLPVNTETGKVVYEKNEFVQTVSAVEIIKRTKSWFLNYYKTTELTEIFNVPKRELQPKYEKGTKTVDGKIGFYVMYPSDISGLNIEKTYVLVNLTVALTDSGFCSRFTEMTCYGSLIQKEMRPPKFPIESFNEPRLNGKNYVQNYVIPQVNAEINKFHAQINRAIQSGIFGF